MGSRCDSPGGAKKDRVDDIREIDVVLPVCLCAEACPDLDLKPVPQNVNFFAPGVQGHEEAEPALEIL